MADETRTANVELSADVSGYNTGIQQATTRTNTLTESVKKLSSSLEGITGRMGKRLLIFSAADTAAMTGFVAVAAKYEKQMQTLNAQSVISGRQLHKYTEGINQLARVIPVSRGELAQLVTQINQMGVTSERQAVSMARVFTNMAASTGESVGSLTAGMIELSRTMGTLGSGDTAMSNFADSVVTVSNNAGVAATSVLALAQNLSPLARSANISQTEIIGLATAFSKAGQDGTAASTTFTNVIADITRLTQTGSPELAKYSNAIGMSLEAFKNLSAAEQFTSIVKAVNEAGPRASAVLNQMGIDGTRMVKVFAALSSVPGGLQGSIDQARNAYGNGNNEKGAGAAFNTMSAQIQIAKQNIEDIAATIGDALLPVATEVVKVFNAGAQALNTWGEPLLKITGYMGGIAAVMTGIAGTVLSMMAPLSTLMLGSFVARSAPVMTFFGGIRDAIAARRGVDRPLSMGGRMAAEDAARAARGEAPLMRWYQSGPYAAGARTGDVLGRMPVGAQATFRTAGTLAANATTWFAQGTSSMYGNAARPWWQRIPGMSGIKDVPITDSMTTGQAWRNAAAHPLATARGLFSFKDNTLYDAASAKIRADDASARESANARNASYWINKNKLDQQGLPGQPAPKISTSDAVKDANKVITGHTTALGKNATELGRHAAALINSKGTNVALAAASAQAARSLVGVSLASAKFGGSMLLQGAALPFRMLGSLTGLGATASGFLAGGAALAYMDQQRKNSLNVELSGNRNIADINSALGIATDPLNNFVTAVKNGTAAIKDMNDALMLTPARAAAAQTQEYTDKGVANLPDVQTAIAYAQSMGPMNKEQTALLMNDMAKRFGYADASRVSVGYQKTLENTRWSPDVVTSLYKGVAPLAIEKQGWLQGLNSQVPDEVKGLMDQILTTVNQDAMKYAGQTNSRGQDLGEIVRGTSLAAFVDESMKAINYDYQGNENMYDRKNRTENEKARKKQAFKALETEFGGETGVDINRIADVNGTKELIKYLEENAGDNKTAKAIVDSLKQASSGEDINNWITQAGAETTKTALNNTSLGQFMNNNEVVSKVTLGGSEDPRDIIDAINTLTAEAVKAAGAYSTASDDLVTNMNNIGDKQSVAYQVASASLAQVQRRATYEAGTQGGWRGSAQEAWTQGRNMMGINDVAQNQQGQQQMMAVQEDVQKRLSQLVLAEEDYRIQKRQSAFDRERQLEIARRDFDRQRLRATESFARSMKRAYEDAASSITSPFERVFSTSTMTGATLNSNLQDQQKKIDQQMKNLDILRKRGLSDSAISGMNLTDFSMQGQVAQMLYTSPAELAKTSALWDKREGSAKDYVESQRGTKRQREDFWIGMDQGAEDFKISMDDASKSFEIAARRAEKSIGRLGREANGTITELYTQATNLAVALGIDNIDMLTQIGILLGANPDIADQESTPGTATNYQAGDKRKDPSGLFTAQYQGSGGGQNYSVAAYATRRYGTGPERLPDNWLTWSEKDAREWFYYRPEEARPDGRNPKAQVESARKKSKRVAQAETNQWSLDVGRATGVPGSVNPNYRGLSVDVVKGMDQNKYATPMQYNPVSQTYNNIVNYSGVTVISQDPDDMGRKLDKKHRQKNLRLGANAKN